MALHDAHYTLQARRTRKIELVASSTAPPAGISTVLHAQRRARRYMQLHPELPRDTHRRHAQNSGYAGRLVLYMPVDFWRLKNTSR
jgi:hypothetical protein